MSSSISRAIAVLTLFAGTAALAQPAKTLPGGAVLKPERPVPIHPGPPPKYPPPEKSPGSPPANPPPAQPSAPSLPPSMQPLAPLLGDLSGTTKAGAPVRVQCLAVAADTWLRCDVAVDKTAALVAIGWDDRAGRFNAFVGDSTGKSKLYKGRWNGSKLVFSGPSRVILDLENPQQIVLSTGNEVVTLVRNR